MLVTITTYALLTIAVVTLIVLWNSIYSVGPTQVGLVRKRFGKRLPDDNPIAFHNEAGYQAELQMPGLRFRFLPFYAVTKHPWVQVPAGQIGLVIAQIGQPLPIGAKSAVYTHGFGNFTDLNAFVEGVAGPGGLSGAVIKFAVTVAGPAVQLPPAQAQVCAAVIFAMLRNSSSA